MSLPPAIGSKQVLCAVASLPEGLWIQLTYCNWMLRVCVTACHVCTLVCALTCGMRAGDGGGLLIQAFQDCSSSGTGTAAANVTLSSIRVDSNSAGVVTDSKCVCCERLCWRPTCAFSYPPHCSRRWRRRWGSCLGPSRSPAVGVECNSE
jgi:hypothetical protein